MNTTEQASPKQNAGILCKAIAKATGLNLFVSTVDKTDNGYTVVLTSEEDESLTFQRLDKVSEVFQTKKIDIESESQYYCDTCDYGSTLIILTLKDAQLPELPATKL